MAFIPLLVLAGPTASGKTALAIALAAALRDEVNGEEVACEAVSADSRQIYRLMDLATAKPTAAERAQLPHHLIDVAWPDEDYTLAQYQHDAQAAIADIAARGALPLLVGGTGLYLRAVVENLAIPRVPPNPALRAELEAEVATGGPAALHRRLAALDPATAATIDARNPRRLIRALEVCLATGQPLAAQQGRRPTPYRTLRLGLTLERAALYARADARIDAMLAAGLVDETRALLARGYAPSLPAMSSLGYREMCAYLRGELTLEAAVARFTYATHAYIRRQLTWFRAEPRIAWLDAAEPLPLVIARALDLIRTWRQQATPPIQCSGAAGAIVASTLMARPRVRRTGRAPPQCWRRAVSGTPTST